MVNSSNDKNSVDDGGSSSEDKVDANAAPDRVQDGGNPSPENENPSPENKDASDQGLEVKSSDVDSAVVESTPVVSEHESNFDKNEPSPKKSSTEPNTQDKKNNVLHQDGDNVPSSVAGKSKASKLWLIAVFLIFILLILVVGAAYWTINYFEKKDAQNAENNIQIIESLEKEIAGLSNTMKSTSVEFSQLESKIRNQLKNENAEIVKRLKAAEGRLQAQNKRLLSMSTTTREDWLLAEAEYLLKLASQRVLIEKSSESAASLLEEADGILRDLGDPDLYALREVIRRDLTALRLVEKVDQEGIYLNLLALANEINSLPVLPKYTSQKNMDSVSDRDELNSAAGETVENTGNGSDYPDAKKSSKTSLLIIKIKSSFAKVVEKIKSSFNIVKYDESSMAMVSPQASVYVRQNLRLIIERAQLALLREQQTIYDSSLKQAEQWLLEYFPRSEKRALFLEELKTVANKNIVRDLPKISESLNLLNAYIQDLHQLKGVSKPTVNKSQTKKSIKNVPEKESVSTESTSEIKQTSEENE